MTTAVSGNQDRIAIGCGAMLLSMAGFSGMDSIAKLMGESYPIHQVVFFRNFFGLFPVLIMVWAAGLQTLKTEHIWLQRSRGLIVLIAQGTFFWGLQFMGLADAMALAFAAPLFITALAGPVLGEKVGIRRWLAVIVGFLGVLVILRPGGSLFQPAALLVLNAALFYGLLMLTSRKLSRTDSNTAIMFHASSTAFVASFFLLPFGFVWPSWMDLALFAAMGFLGSGSVYFIVVAYRYAPAAVVSPYEYSALLWGTLYGWLIWRELPDPNVWIGAGILVAAGIYILYRETRTLPKTGAPGG